MLAHFEESIDEAHSTPTAPVNQRSRGTTWLLARAGTGVATGIALTADAAIFPATLLGGMLGGLIATCATPSEMERRSQILAPRLHLLVGAIVGSAVGGALGYTLLGRYGYVAGVSLRAMSFLAGGLGGVRWAAALGRDRRPFDGDGPHEPFERAKRRPTVSKSQKIE